MKKIFLLAVVLVLMGAAPCFSGPLDKAISRGIDVVGGSDTALREIDPNGNNDAISTIREVTKPIGVLSSARDVAMVGTTAAAVTGSSGPAIMGTLAAIGKPAAVVAGGAVSATAAGLAVGPGCAGAGAAGLLNEFVFDGDSKADQAARKGTYAGALAGTAGGVATVAAAGTAGMSAAGITSGLAAIGGVVGGGMAAGTILVIAAPVAAAAAIGGLAYWLFSD